MRIHAEIVSSLAFHGPWNQYTDVDTTDYSVQLNNLFPQIIFNIDGSSAVIELACSTAQPHGSSWPLTARTSASCRMAVDPKVPVCVG